MSQNSGARYCTICGQRMVSVLGSWTQHSCGGTPTYCGNCGRQHQPTEPCKPRDEANYVIRY